MVSQTNELAQMRTEFRKVSAQLQKLGGALQGISTASRIVAGDVKVPEMALSRKDLEKEIVQLIKRVLTETLQEIGKHISGQQKEPDEDKSKPLLDQLALLNAARESLAEVQEQLKQVKSSDELLKLYQASTAELEQQRPLLVALASLAGEVGKSAKDALKALDDQVNTLEKTLELMGETLRNTLKSELKRVALELYKGSTTLDQAVISLTTTIFRNVAQAAVPALSAYLSETFVGLFDGMFDEMAETLQEKLSTVLTGVISGEMGLREGLNSIGKTITSEMTRILQQKFVELAKTKILEIFGIGQKEGGGVADAAGAVAGATTLNAAGTSLLGAALALNQAAVALGTASAGNEIVSGIASGASVLSGDSGGSAGGFMNMFKSLFGFAGGGPVFGPGSGSSDSIPAWLSSGEFVTRAAVARQPGALGFLNDFNRRGMAALPGYSTGGLAGMPAPALPAPSLSHAQLADTLRAGASMQNNVNLYAIQNPDEIASMAWSRSGQEHFVVYLQQNAATVRQILEI